MNKKNSIRQALISVSDKSGLVSLAQSLIKRNINIFSTGGTEKFLKKNNITTTSISEYTQFPEIMNGKIKTIHPKIYGSILGNPNDDRDIMNFYNIVPIDLVIVNLYPFSKKIAIDNIYHENILNYIDIGGVTLIRAAAKNHPNVMVVVCPLDYPLITNLLDNNNNTFNIEDKFYMACKAFKYTSQYDKTIFDYLIQHNIKTSTIQLKTQPLPNYINIKLKKKQDLRYGENHHQKAALYFNTLDNQHHITNSISSAKQIQGKLLSYNNISDADIAWECVQSFKNPACVIVKHGTPCGVSESTSLLNAYLSAYHCDSISAFGGVIAFNHILNSITIHEILKTQFVEVIIADSVTESGLEILKLKKNIRVILCNKNKNKNCYDIKSIHGGGFLVQDSDTIETNYNAWKNVSFKTPTNREYLDLIFAWKVVKFVKSNAIVYVQNQSTISIGSGQTSRIDSTKIATSKINDKKQSLKNIVMASDAFLPFRDNVDEAIKIGVSCIIQPGGSIKDQEIIQAANEHNIIMIFTNKRHFKH
ncbi:MAG: bifunctional phosphoribosylaminoimidazolecarboxamide formyltransferase/IMP cyclohydrolase [Buchnera aphidicola (Eriosoma harunire)]